MKKVVINLDRPQIPRRVGQAVVFFRKGHRCHGEAVMIAKIEGDQFTVYTITAAAKSLLHKHKTGRARKVKQFTATRQELW